MSTKDGEADGDSEDPMADERRPMSQHGFEYKKQEQQPQQRYNSSMAIKSGINKHSDSAYAVARNQTRSEEEPVGRALRSISLSSSSHGLLDGETDACVIAIPPCMFSEELAELLQHAPAEPPVTTESLQELDLIVIKNNPSLRIDLNHDADLHFMPISGSRGEEKRTEAEKYFRCLRYELSIYQHSADPCCTVCKEHRLERTVFLERLRPMFSHLRNLLLMLVPEEDHQVIVDNVEVELRVQEVRNGVFDVSKFSTWLKVLLTSHCAPFRDDSAADMARTMTEAAADGDVYCLVQGLQKLFSFLESMRLDVANHQIRTLRAPLIDDGIAFQIGYFETRIYQGTLNVNGSRQWFQHLCQVHCQSEPDSVTNGRDLFVKGLVKICSFTDSALPITLKHDGSRLRAIQRELQDEIHLQACREVHRQLALRLLTTRASPTSNTRLIPSRLMALLEDDRNYPVDQLHELWLDNVEPIATEITRQVYHVVGVASLAIPSKMFAATTINLEKILKLERHQHRIADLVSKDLEARVLQWCHTFHSMTPLEISEQQRRQQREKANSDRAWTARPVPDIEDIARRLAHMAVIHWRVWRGLAYLDWEVCKAFRVDDEGVLGLELDFVDEEGRAGLGLDDVGSGSLGGSSEGDDDIAVWEDDTPV